MHAVVTGDSLAQDFLEAVLGRHSTVVLAHYTKGHGSSQWFTMVMWALLNPVSMKLSCMYM